MIEELLDFYERELGFIREEAREFARQNPKIAGRLRLSTGDTVEDPHVSRLIEAFALLCARLRLKMEDEFPEICQAMLQALYPQYIAPVPSVAICQFAPTEVAAENHQGVAIQRGSVLETEEVDGQPCLFRTCYRTQVFPVVLESAQYRKPPFTFPVDPTWTNNVQAALHLRLKATSDKLPISKMALSRLRLYLGSAESCGNELYEAMLHDAIGVGLFSSAAPEGVFLPASTIRPVGFGDEEALVEHDARSISAFRYLWEFFADADKFRFVELDLGEHARAIGSQDLDVVVFLRKSNQKILRELRNDTIALGCTPIVNLFRHHAEPIRLTGNQVEYRVVPSFRRPRGMEVYSIDRVSASSPGGLDQREFLPFHLPSHSAAGEEDGEEGRYWHVSRRRRLSENLEGDRGTEVFLTIVDLQSRAKPEQEWTLHVDTTCCNRDLVNDLPSGVGRPWISLHESSGQVTASVLTVPSPTRRPVTRDDFRWRLISHLSLNHLTLTDTDMGAETLREILRLYNPSDQEEHRKAIDAIQSVRYSRGVARVAAGVTRGDNDAAAAPPAAINVGAGFCRGLEIEILVDEERLAGIGAYLFSTVLDRFFACFATINSYTRLRIRKVSDGQLLYSGRARAGTKELL